MTHEDPTFSIIIGAYNVASYIEGAIRSALSQEGVSLEIIVVDDGSQDATVAIARSIVDARVTVIAQTINGGPSVARNTAIAAARGAWIAVLDGDDQYLPGRLCACLARATALNADIVVDNLMVFTEADGSSALMFPEHEFNARQILTISDYIDENSSFLGGYALGYLKPIFSARFLKQHALSYDPSLRIGEDYLLMIQALAYGAQCAVLPAAGYRYTVRSGSISHRITAADVSAIAEADQKLITLFPAKLEIATLAERRTRNLKEALAFSNLVEAIKAKDLRGAIGAIAPSPLVLRHLWRPVMVRLLRITNKIGL